jgi:DNA repair exonuclease SbcCD nuclease subunit
MFRFLHTADLHLDSPLRGLEARDGAPVDRIRRATRDAFRNIVDLSLREEVAFVVISGDVFDGDWKDFQTGVFFLRELSRLREAGIRVFLIRGNHDSACEVTHHLQLPPHVKLFSAHTVETEVLDDLGAAVHGYSFPKRQVTENVVPRFPSGVAAHFNIGMLHTSAEGSSEHETYAPCSVRELAAKGYQYWALGHVHGRAVLHERPWVVFPGNPQGRHARECGPKGATLVTVEGGEVESLEHVPTDTVRFFDASVVLEEADSLDDLHDKVSGTLSRAVEDAGERLAAVRLRIRGRTRAHGPVVERRAEVLGRIEALAADHGDNLWLEKVSIETAPSVPIETLREGQGLAGAVLRRIAALRSSPDEAAALVGEVLGPLSRSMAESADALGLSMWPEAILAQAEALLAARFEEGTGT